MKLSLILERRKPVNHRRMFAGSHASKTSNGKLSGLRASKTNSELTHDSNDALFFTPDVSIALYYGPYVVEILMNENDNQTVRDEEHFPLGEIPHEPPESNVKSWDNFWKYFDEIIPLPNENERRLFLEVWRNVYKKHGGDFDQFDDDFANVVRKIFLRRTIKSNGGNGWAGNVMRISSHDISYRGRTRIVGEYLFSRDGAEYVCTNVFYNKGGSITVGDKFRRVRDWMG